MIDLLGQRFVRLVVTGRGPRRNGGGATWICRCDCGNVKTVRSKNLRHATSPTKSCGCLGLEVRRARHLVRPVIGKIHCATCGKQVESHDKHKRFCSKACSGRYYRRQAKLAASIATA